MGSELREKSIYGMLWNALERFGSSFFLFIANLILARLLSPADFGAIAMLIVFISIAETIVDAGFSSALIQKKDVDQKDCSTIFIWNIIFSILLYVILFFSAPTIANFYNIEILKDVLRIQGIVIPLNALVLVHIALLKKQLDFKRIAKINLVGIIIGTAVGIGTAFYGAGVWSLVFKLLLTAVVQVVCYYAINIWSPSFSFDYERFKSMFRFGGFIFINRIVNTVYHNIMALIIGKAFSAATLGSYNQARKLEDIPRSALSSVVNNVAFSAFSQIHTDMPRFKSAASKCMRNMSFLSIPLMILAIVVAEPLILFLFTAKWAEAIPYFQILCISGLTITPLELNTEILNAMGKSNITFLSRLIMCVVGTLCILLGVLWGMPGLLIAYVITQFLGFAVSALFSGKYVGYGFFKQLRDISPFLIISLVAAVVAIIPVYISVPIKPFVMLFVQTSIFALVYIILSWLIGVKELETYKGVFIKNKV